MAERTGIAWARSTFNPWIGCTEVSPGCDGCYARELDKRHRYGGAEHWGAGVPRFHTSEAYWRQPEKWNRLAARERMTGKIEDRSLWHTPGFWPVFPSMCDPFDNEVDRTWRREFLKLVLATQHLTWLLLTKRIGNALKMLPHPWPDNPPPNVWIGASIVNQEEADRDIPKLQSVPAEKRFVSYEPALGPVDWDRFLSFGGIDQVIVGGESSQGKHAARRFAIERARTAKDACELHGVSFFMKQAGAHVSWQGMTASPEERWPAGTRKEDLGEGYFRIRLKDRAGADLTEWPEDLRVQEFPL
jgi:protein gp37